MTDGKIIEASEYWFGLVGQVYLETTLNYLTL